MMFNRLKGLSFRYFLSIAGKARLSLARFIIIIFSSLYFCVRLNFGFDIPLVIYVVYTILVNIIFMSIFFLFSIKFERILKSYLNFFYDRFFLFNKLVNMYLEFYLGFFKVPLYGFSLYML